MKKILGTIMFVGLLSSCTLDSELNEQDNTPLIVKSIRPYGLKNYLYEVTSYELFTVRIITNKKFNLGDTLTIIRK